jgi:hypothetical protein
VEVHNNVCYWLNGKSNGLVHWEAALRQNPNTLALALDDTHFGREGQVWRGGWHGDPHGVPKGRFIRKISLALPQDWRYAYIEIEDRLGRRAWTNNLLEHDDKQTFCPTFDGGAYEPCVLDRDIGAGWRDLRLCPIRLDRLVRCDERDRDRHLDRRDGLRCLEIPQ